ncbi:MAG: hypothetical protein K1060chlam5_00451 [Candidatus Anoxychlamydiales bacterium]|nr:hypothetical protein [Candidatus Anoxychlamydiales bacterium]
MTSLSFIDAINRSEDLKKDFERDKKGKCFSLKTLCSFAIYNENDENKDTIYLCHKVALKQFEEYIRKYC